MFEAVCASCGAGPQQPVSLIQCPTSSLYFCHVCRPNLEAEIERRPREEITGWSPMPKANVRRVGLG